MGLLDSIAGDRKTSHDELRKSQDFRKEKKFSEPKIPFLTSIFAFPYIGLVHGYYLTLLAFFVLFLVTKISFIGLLAGLNILFIVAWEFYVGSKTGGVKNELKDTVLAVGLGLLVWFGSGFILNTPTPINAIVSCSMLPNYERGDMIILQGGELNTQYVQYEGKKEDITRLAKVEYDSRTYEIEGSLYTYCQGRASEPICLAFYKNPGQFREVHGPLELQYGNCVKQDINTAEKRNIACITDTVFEGQKIEFSKDYDLIVYQPKSQDLYALVGDIVHRARFAINASDGIIYFTKGDNNPIYDFQIYSTAYKKGNGPVEPGQIKGKSILRIPFIGNFKLFITPQVLFLDDDSTGCNEYFVE